MLPLIEPLVVPLPSWKVPRADGNRAAVRTLKRQRQRARARLGQTAGAAKLPFMSASCP